MAWWTEFKTTLLPWLIASAVVALVIVESHRTTAQLLAMNQTLTLAVQEQGKTLEGVRQLLGAQGYTVSPPYPVP